MSACQKKSGKEWIKLKELKERLPQSDYDEARGMAMNWIKENGRHKEGFGVNGIVDPINLTVIDYKSLENIPIYCSSSVSRTMINNQLRIKWHELCANNEHYGSHIFRFLLACDYNESDLNDLFQYYDCKDELVKRLMASKNMTRPESVSVRHVKSLVRQDLLSK